MTYLTAYKIVDEKPRAFVKLNPIRPGGRCVEVTAIAPALKPTTAVNPLILTPIHLLRLYSVCCLKLLVGFVPIYQVVYIRESVIINALQVFSKEPLLAGECTDGNDSIDCIVEMRDQG